jgi:hypothetical protein
MISLLNSATYQSSITIIVKPILDYFVPKSDIAFVCRLFWCKKCHLHQIGAIGHKNAMQLPYAAHSKTGCSARIHGIYREIANNGIGLA